MVVGISIKPMDCRATMDIEFIDDIFPFSWFPTAPPNLVGLMLPTDLLEIHFVINS